jgi:hypothetical protein
MTMRIWLDDKRPMPEGYDTHVKTAEEAIRLIDLGCVTHISLDNFLADENVDHMQGWQVAKHIEQQAINGTLRMIRCYIHTGSIDAREKIKEHLRGAHRAWMLNR